MEASYDYAWSWGVKTREEAIVVRGRLDKKEKKASKGQGRELFYLQGRATTSKNTGEPYLSMHRDKVSEVEQKRIFAEFYKTGKLWSAKPIPVGIDS